MNEDSLIQRDTVIELRFQALERITEQMADTTDLPSQFWLANAWDTLGNDRDMLLDDWDRLHTEQDAMAEKRDLAAQERLIEEERDREALFVAARERDWAMIDRLRAAECRARNARARFCAQKDRERSKIAREAALRRLVEVKDPNAIRIERQEEE